MLPQWLVPFMLENLLYLWSDISCLQTLAAGFYYISAWVHRPCSFPAPHLQTRSPSAKAMKQLPVARGVWDGPALFWASVRSCGAGRAQKSGLLPSLVLSHSLHLLK